MATQSLDDVLNIIEIIKEEHEVGISEISKRLKLNKNKVFRMLVTLELKGIVKLNKETGKYKLGKNFIKLYHSYLQNLNFLNAAKISVRNLRQEVNENVYISINHGKDIIYVYEEPSYRSVIIKSFLAKRFRANKTAAGRVLKKSKKEKGFIVEYDIGSEISEVATVIRDEFYYPIASLSIIAPSVRMSIERIGSEIKEKLIETAEEITENLAPTFSLD